MIKVENLSFKYSGDKKHILKNLSFNVNTGETVAILGQNGIGKTTFLKCLLGFLNYYSGEIYLDNKSTKNISQNKFWKLVSYIPQSKKLQ